MNNRVPDGEPDDGGMLANRLRNHYAQASAANLANVPSRQSAGFWSPAATFGLVTGGLAFGLVALFALSSSPQVETAELDLAGAGPGEAAQLDGAVDEAPAPRLNVTTEVPAVVAEAPAQDTTEVPQADDEPNSGPRPSASPKPASPMPDAGQEPSEEPPVTVTTTGTAPTSTTDDRPAPTKPASEKPATSAKPASGSEPPTTRKPAANLTQSTQVKPQPSSKPTFPRPPTGAKPSFVVPTTSLYPDVPPPSLDDGQYPARFPPSFIGSHVSVVKDWATSHQMRVEVYPEGTALTRDFRTGLVRVQVDENDKVVYGIVG